MAYSSSEAIKRLPTQNAFTTVEKVILFRRLVVAPNLHHNAQGVLIPSRPFLHWGDMWVSARTRLYPTCTPPPHGVVVPLGPVVDRRWLRCV